MAAVERNAPCPCGSGKKYKKCCLAKAMSEKPSNESSTEPVGLQPAIRMKGGVMLAPESQGYVAVIHSWNNAECRGEPTEWRDPKIFKTEDAAMHYYKNTIRPLLEELMTDVKKDLKDVSAFRQYLEE